MAKKKMKLDLNSKCLRKPCEEQCPSVAILEEAKMLGIKFLIGTDAHRGNELESGLKECKALSKTL